MFIIDSDLYILTNQFQDVFQVSSRASPYV